MKTEQDVTRALTDLADSVRSRPDPYGRVVRRYRRQRRRRTVALVLAAVVGLTAAGLTVSAPRHRTVPVTSDPSPSLARWIERLRESPVRGSLAHDAAFLAAFHSLVLSHQRAGDYPVHGGASEADVVFAGDVGDRRIALVAFRLEGSDPNRSDGSAWFVAPLGTDPPGLARPEMIAAAGDDLDPFPNLPNYVSVAAVAVAPNGCTVESAPLPGADVWTPEPTGSYLVRTAARAEWWRVVCDGEVRQTLPAPGGRADRWTDEQVAAATARARGVVDTELCRDALIATANSYGWVINATPSVVWSGRPTGAGAPDGWMVVVAAPGVRGGWYGQVELTYDTPSAGTPGSAFGFYTDTDPGPPDAVLAVRNPETLSVLVVTPPSTVTVQVLAGGVVSATASVHDEATMLARVADGAVVEALDRDGTVIASTTMTEPAAPRLFATRWN